MILGEQHRKTVGRTCDKRRRTGRRPPVTKHVVQDSAGKKGMMESLQQAYDSASETDSWSLDSNDTKRAKIAEIESRLEHPEILAPEAAPSVGSQAEQPVAETGLSSDVKERHIGEDQPHSRNAVVKSHLVTAASFHRELYSYRRGYAIGESTGNEVYKSKRTRALPEARLAAAAAGSKEVRSTRGQPAGALAVESSSRVDMEKNLPRSVYHGSALSGYDYQGRSFMLPPKGVRAVSEREVLQSFLPRRCAATIRAHEEGISTVRFAPEYGHLLLSGSMDKTVKLWSTHPDTAHGRCIRSYMGHAKAVRDVCFAGDSAHFLSAGFDGVVWYWDTETGQAISKIRCAQTSLAASSKVVAYCAKFRAGPTMSTASNELLVARSDKKITQHDVRVSDPSVPIQTYNQHLAAVNSVVFIEDGERFISSSDDKTLCVWDWGIPVVIKYISDPSMFSMPSAAVHPSGSAVTYQSMDNKLVTYGLRQRDRFKQNSRKTFVGHVSAGYACEPCFSTDGRFLASGDALGRLFFWDWSTARVAHALQAHDGACSSVQWHPTETGTVVTAGWDGMLKVWRHTST
ncbi:Pre-mRNA-processing factor 17 [Porphyridium purpureum]|uniref:Pre-mRNA-processing factor 17 n=1 Tax=Porphyridium purpureum TaxID=35688 RepID=A0A5J4ZB42_PORPP|nr:Pre-mRNA-processing factor 17 [Porphyridium purpureum]|eukprot:POR5849..scf295_1